MPIMGIRGIPDENNFVHRGRIGDFCYIKKKLIHADTPDNGNTSAADQGKALTGKGTGNSIRIADGSSSNNKRCPGSIGKAVAGAFTGEKRSDTPEPCFQGKDRTQGKL